MLLNLLHIEHFSVFVVVSPGVVRWLRKSLVSAISGFHLCRAMIKGRIATPSAKSLKRPRPERKKRKQPAVASAIVTASAPKKRLRGPVIRLREQQHGKDAGQEQAKPSAIVEPKRKSNSMLAHLLEDITDAERNRRADMADETFREVRRRAALQSE